MKLVSAVILMLVAAMAVLMIVFRPGQFDAEIRKKSGITSQVQGWKRVRSKILAKSEKQGPETKGRAQSRIF